MMADKDEAQRLATICLVFGDARTTALAKYENELKLHYIELRNIDIDTVGMEITFEGAHAPMPLGFFIAPNGNISLGTDPTVRRLSPGNLYDKDIANQIADVIADNVRSIL